MPKGRREGGKEVRKNKGTKETSKKK